MQQDKICNECKHGRGVLDTEQTRAQREESSWPAPRPCMPFSCAMPTCAQKRPGPPFNLLSHCPSQHGPRSQSRASNLKLSVGFSGWIDTRLSLNLALILGPTPCLEGINLPGRSNGEFSSKTRRGTNFPAKRFPVLGPCLFSAPLGLATTARAISREPPWDLWLWNPHLQKGYKHHFCPRRRIFKVMHGLYVTSWRKWTSPTGAQGLQQCSSIQTCSQWRLGLLASSSPTHLGARHNLALNEDANTRAIAISGVHCLITTIC